MSPSPCICLPIYLSAWLSVYLSIFHLVPLSTYLSVYLSITNCEQPPRYFCVSKYSVDFSERIFLETSAMDAIATEEVDEEVTENCASVSHVFIHTFIHLRYYFLGEKFRRSVLIASRRFRGIPERRISRALPCSSALAFIFVSLSLACPLIARQTHEYN